jgi:glycerol-3-phosphate dehydrogenase
MLRLTGEMPDYAMRLVRGSHIVVPALFDHPYAYFFQLPDGRIFFAIPYERDFTLIGTTDADHTGPLSDVRASAEEIA